jgi:hypothetical protein
MKISPKSMFDQNTRGIVKLHQLALKFSCKTARRGRVTFFQRKTSSLPYLHKNFETVHHQLQQLVQNLERKFDNMSWFAAIVFSNIAGISKVGRIRVRAKGLRLRNNREMRSCGCRTFLLIKQEK